MPALYSLRDIGEVNVQLSLFPGASKSHSQKPTQHKKQDPPPKPATVASSNKPASKSKKQRVVKTTSREGRKAAEKEMKERTKR